MKRKQPKTIEMKKNKIFKPAFIFIKLSAIIALIIVSQSCNSDKKLKKGEHLESKKDDVIEIVTELMDFQTQDTIPSGWNTFKYMNNSAETHFFLLDKYPEGKSIEDAKKEVGPPFQAGMDLINEGKVEEGYEQFNKLPAWFFEVIYFGGSGLVSSNNSSLTTVKLEAGYYIMECYVKMANGKFHSSMGMEKVIIVTNNDSGNLPPKSSIDINISSTEGITYNNAILVQSNALENAQSWKALRIAYENVLNRGTKHLYYQMAEGQLGFDGEGTVDGVHPTDLGFHRQAGVYQLVLENIIKGNKEE